MRDRCCCRRIYHATHTPLDSSASPRPHDQDRHKGDWCAAACSGGGFACWQILTSPHPTLPTLGPPSHHTTIIHTTIHKHAACSTSTHDLATALEEGERGLAFGGLLGGRLCFLGQGTYCGEAFQLSFPLALRLPLGLLVQQHCFSHHSGTRSFCVACS